MLSDKDNKFKISKSSFFPFLFLFLSILIFIYLWMSYKIGKMNEESKKYKENIKILEKKLKIISNFPANTTFFKIYGYDELGDAEEISFYITISDSLDIKDKLKILANNLSKYKFNNNIIELLTIDKISEKTIAIINLVDKNNKKNSINWKNYYFTNPKYGKATSITLIKTFLQADYKGKWIDGVEFYYNGKPLEQDKWENIDLYGVHLR